MGCHFLLQEIFQTQGLNPGSLHCRQMLYCPSHQESPLSQTGSLSLDLYVDLREGGKKPRLRPDASPAWGHTWSFPEAPYCPCIWHILYCLLSAPKGKVQSSSRLESTSLPAVSLPALELKKKKSTAEGRRAEALRSLEKHTQCSCSQLQDVEPSERCEISLAPSAGNKEAGGEEVRL